MSLRAEAFAKTNRAILVVGKRPDGYHDLDTVFQSIDLTDRIEVEESDSVILECDDPRLPAGPENLICRAASALAKACGVRAGARIRLEKRIPVGAGLGGGSSDCAIALVLLSRLWEIEAGLDSLREIGAGIGSDVAFFFQGGSARGTGRGEILTPLSDGPDRVLVLVVPPFPISTAAVYSRWRAGSAAHRPSDPIPGAYFGVNELASAVLETNPEMARYLDAVAKFLPDCQISGSGSSIVASAAEGCQIDSILSGLRDELPAARVRLARSVSRREYWKRTTLDGFESSKKVGAS
ncbi:MAG: 4-(cytidine 5'-diphospho)-2-C-methyl-D-erythritol kinase [Thermoanaerobaculia bacterium]